MAASSYLNTAPLIWSFQQGSLQPAVQLLTDAAPAYCADLLAREEVEVALVPVIEYQRIPGSRIIPEVCVGSSQAVRSVILISKHNDLKQVRQVALDSQSRTSQALVKIIFREFLETEPTWKTAAPDVRSMLEHTDAALMIGDPAMNISSEQYHVFDLASLWHRFTGTGFVFAMWMTRAKNEAAAREVDFATARDEGLENIEVIIDQYEKNIALPRAELRRYLTENISFTVDKKLEQGMSLYFELASKHRLIPNNRPLEFVSR